MYERRMASAILTMKIYRNKEPASSMSICCALNTVLCVGYVYVTDIHEAPKAGSTPVFR
jgi:hypothetical protein